MDGLSVILFFLSVQRRDRGTTPNAIIRETLREEEINKLGFQLSFTSIQIMRMFFLFYPMSHNGRNWQFLCNRVSAKRHLTIDTVPVTLLDIHLECDKVKNMELVPILIVTNCLWCRAWHPGVIAQGPHQTQTNQIGEQSNRPTPEKAFLKVVAGRTKTHITDHFLSRSRDEDVVVPLIPKKQRPQKKF